MPKSQPNNVELSGGNPNYISPSDIVEAARATMRGITLDPCSSIDANRVVQADHIYTPEDDGLTQDFFGKVYMNPHGSCLVQDRETGKWRKSVSGESAQVVWLKRLMHFYLCRPQKVSQAVYLSFNPEILRNPAIAPLMQQYPYCIPSSRLRFQNWDETNQVMVTDNKPRKWSIIFYFPPKKRDLGVARFLENFGPLGYVCDPLDVKPSTVQMLNMVPDMSTPELASLVSYLDYALKVRKLGDQGNGMGAIAAQLELPEHMEMKMIHGSGPYPYVRSWKWEDGKRVHKSRYSKGLAHERNRAIGAPMDDGE